MFFDAPDNCNEVNVGGNRYVVTNGQIETPNDPETADFLLSHGFVMADEKKAVETVKAQGKK
jgi:hypothetical protein